MTANVTASLFGMSTGEQKPAWLELENLEAQRFDLHAMEKMSLGQMLFAVLEEKRPRVV